ncbi:MAG: Hpt domain-containing protein [Chloroflexales bacterium]
MTERMFDPYAPTLDTAVLQEFVEAGGPCALEVIREIVVMFLEETPPLLADLGTAIHHANHAQVVSIAHELRESCHELGAYAMAGRCAILEECLPREAAVLSQSVNAEYRRAMDALRIFLTSIV